MTAEKRGSLILKKPREASDPPISRGVIRFESECAVKDVTESGATILLPAPDEFPETFRLQIDSGQERTCRIAWRKDSEIGVEFIKPSLAKKHFKETDIRRSMRESIFEKGIVVYNDGFCTMDCEVRDYSNEGARIRPLNPRDCPVYFQLRIKHGPTRNCMVLHRTGRDFGVRFLPE